MYHSKYLAQDCLEAVDHFKQYAVTLQEYRAWLEDHGKEKGGSRRKRDARRDAQLHLLNRMKISRLAAAQKMGYIEGRLAFPSYDTAFNNMRLEIGLFNVERALQESNKETNRMVREGHIQTDGNAAWAEWTYAGSMKGFRAKWEGFNARVKAQLESPGLADAEKKSLEKLVAEASYNQPDSIPAE